MMAGAPAIILDPWVVAAPDDGGAGTPAQSASCDLLLCERKHTCIGIVPLLRGSSDLWVNLILIGSFLKTGPLQTS